VKKHPNQDNKDTFYFIIKLNLQTQGGIFIIMMMMGNTLLPILLYTLLKIKLPKRFLFAVMQKKYHWFPPKKNPFSDQF